MRTLACLALLSTVCLVGCKGVDSAAEAQNLSIRATEIVESDTPPHVDPSYGAPAAQPWPCGPAPHLQPMPFPEAAGGEAATGPEMPVIGAPEDMVPPAGAALTDPFGRPLSPAETPFADLENAGKRIVPSAPPAPPVTLK